MAQPNRALVIIDLQNEFLASTGCYPILASSQENLLTNLTALVREFRKKGDIIWVKAIYDSKGGGQPPDDSESSSHSSSPDTSSSQARTENMTHKGTPCCEA